MARRSKGYQGTSSGGKYRSAKTGRYVTSKHGKSSPRTTVRESESKGSSKKSPGGPKSRSAITGRYVTRRTVERHPDTTVTEGE